MQLREIAYRERERFIMAIIPILSIVALNYYNLLNLKDYFGSDLALAIYGLIGIVIYLISVAIEAILVPIRIKVVPMQNHYHEVLPKPWDGNEFFAGLDVIIPKAWELTDCLVTLEKITPIYYEDRVLLDTKFTKWFSDKTKPEYKSLRWKKPSAGYRVNIGEGDASNRETVLVVKIVKGIVKDVRNKKVDIKTLDFCLFNAKSTSVSFHPFGLYEIDLVLYWRRNGIKGSKNLSGYIYSDGNYKTLLRLGDYNKDKDIPKPLLKKSDGIKSTKVAKKRVSKKTAT
jgi:hypothetical protein